MAPATKFSGLFILTAACLFLMTHLTDNPEYAGYSIPFFIIGAIIYILAPQINWYFYKKNPPIMPIPLRKLFETRIPFYQKLHPNKKVLFRERVMLYLEANDFKAQGIDEVPEDIKAIIAASAVQLTLNREDYLLSKFENLIIYPHPFPSPQYSAWHVCENYEEDGVIMFAAEHLMKGFMQPNRFYPIGLYEYANVFQIMYPDLNYPKLGEESWGLMKKINGFGKEEVTKWIGLPNISLLSVVIVNFILFREAFDKLMPETSKELAKIFG